MVRQKSLLRQALFLSMIVEGGRICIFTGETIVGEAALGLPAIWTSCIETLCRGGYYPPAITNIKTQQARKGPAKNSQKPVQVGSEGKESAERKTV